MNYIKHLSGFFDKVSLDYDLNPTHVSLYMAIFQMWNLNRFQNPIAISRDELMRISKISSTATYHKCIKELTQKGYIDYKPSYNPFKGSILEVCNLDFYTKPIPKKELKKLKNNNQTVLNNDQVGEQVTKQVTKQVDEQVIEQALNKYQTSAKQALNKLPIYNKHNKTYTNIINLEQAKKNENENEISNEFLDQKMQKEKKFYPEPVEGKLRQNKEPEKSKVQDAIPDIDQVKNFFLENNNSLLEAEKFFNYFESNGWLVGGKTKMKDWKAAARNWMINSQKFQAKSVHPERACTELSRSVSPKPNHLQTPIFKNYDEPL